MRLAQVTAAMFLAVALGTVCARANEPGFVDTAWRNEEGLPQATVKAIAETGEGYVWVGTEGGLSRFDGQRFETFDVRRASGCQSVEALDVDASGRLVVGTPCGVLFAEDGRLGPQTIHVPDRRSHPLTSLVASVDGTIWIGTSAGLGFVRNGAIEMLAGSEQANVASLALAKGGGAWVGAVGALGRVDGAQRYQIVARTAGPVRAVREMRDGTVWVGTADGLKRLEAGALVDDPRASLLRDEEILSLHEGRDGQLYIGLQAGGGLRVLDGPATRQLWRTRNPILNVRVTRAGGILYGTQADGLHLLHRPLFRVIQQGAATHEPAWSLFAGPSDELWVGSRMGLLLLTDDAEEPRLVATIASVRTDVLSVIRTREGVVWAGMRDRLVRVEGGGATSRTFGVKDGLPDALIGGMVQDRHGRVWIGTGSGLALVDGDRFVPRAPTGTRVFAMLEGEADDLWVACADGLHLLRDGEPALHLTARDGLPASFTSSLAKTRLGVLAGGAAGLALLRDGKVVGALRGHDGLPADDILGILADDRGRVWLTTNFGVAFVTEDALEAYFSGKSRAVQPRTFGVGDGLPVLECNGGTSSSPILRLRNGEIAFPTMRGIVRFDPAEVGPPPPPSRAVVEGIRLPDGEIHPRFTRALSPGERNVRFEFTAIALASPSRVRFVHQLEGFDGSPSAPSAERSAYYTNLPPGSYRFRVRGCDVEGVCEPEGAVLAVDVEPLVYERRGFWAALALAAMAVGALAYASRTQQLRKRATELGERVAERTRELARANEELQTAFRAAASAQAAVEALLAEIPLSILVYRDGTLRYVNAAGCVLLSASTEDLVGSSVGAEWRAGPEVPVTTPGGKQILAEILRSPFVWTGEPADLVIARDVTEERQLELRAATTERLAALGTLAAGVAHEINNPLAYVTANVDHVRSVLAQQPNSDADAREALAEASDGARRIAIIVKGLTTVARAADDRVEAVDLGAVVSSALTIAGAEIRHRARTEVRGFEGLPAVCGDATRLGQVILNLLTNAAQSFGGLVEDRNLITVVGSRGEGDTVRVEVTDTGSGIPRDHMPRLFDPFFTTKPVGEGTGLGLSVCHGIVRTLGGEITVKSEVGVGTTFTVTLPTWRGGAAAPISVKAERTCTRARVLVIDDDPRVARALGRTLRAHDVTLAQSADVALARIRSGESYDLVLCDLMMPGMNGVGFYGALERERAALLPNVVFMTGGIFTKDVARFIEQSAVVCLQKPISADALIRLVRDGQARGVA